MKSMGYALTCAVLVWLGQAPEGSGNPYLAQARVLLREFKEEEALKVLAKAQRWPQNTPQTLADAHLLTGLAWAALAKDDKALESFKLARLLDPAVAFPQEQAPRVRELWTRAGADSAAADIPLATEAPPVELSPPPPSTPQVMMVRLEPSIPPTRWVGTGLVGAGLVALAVGVIEGVVANTHLAASKATADLSGAQAQYAQATAAAQRANWLYLAGGVLAAGGVVTVVVSF